MELLLLRAALRGLSAYRTMLEQPLLNTALTLVDSLCAGAGEKALEAYTALFYALRAAGQPSLGRWLEETLRYAEGPYPRLAERGGHDPELERAARQDVETLAALAELDCGDCLARMKNLLGAEYGPVLDGLPRWPAEAPFSFASLTEGYRTQGAGRFAQYRAFLWEGGQLIPVADPDPGAEGEMMGYELQREEVVANTRALVEGKTVNNVLLYGDSGTGKSATVKSLLTVPGLEDLRLIEVDKDNLTDLPALIRSLRDRRQKFILFIDDLAFDRDDKTYSVLKTILEGGLEKRPSNVAVYATSNRRHLVRQTFSDRDGDEVDIKETIGEKTSLSERFGVRVAFLPLNKQEYLKLVDRMAAQEGVEMDQEKLHFEALKWEMYHPGRTPRTARQFLDSLHL